ncbi:Protein SGT1-like protein A [Colletotrichum trifolii]|uniref:Protein SGT1-like protein A n=1 Tax=Colletotrichum trifolii TaxID=5466 RepID=A0A4R8RIW3_COLTR|nr:Protein SGT1-like protein A [Colletotrichum trifolii]
MEVTLAEAGITALEAKDYPTAITKLSTALKSTRSPKWLIARSKAYIGASNYPRALRDAEFAFAAASSRGKRDLMADAQHRRAVAYLRMGEYANADTCAAWTQFMADGKAIAEIKEPVVDERGFVAATREALMAEMNNRTKGSGPDAVLSGKETTPKGWTVACALRLQILAQLERLPADDPRRKVTVKFAPGVNLDDFIAGEETEPVVDKKQPTDKVESSDKNEVAAAASESVRKHVVQKDVRVDFFQSNTSVSVSVFAKGVPKDEFKVEYGEQELRMNHIPGHEPLYTIPLYGTIDPAGSKHTITPNKVEFQLKKADAIKWPVLCRDPGSSDAKPAAAAAAPSAAPVAAAPKPAAAAPAYPTSSKKGAQDWDKLDVGDDDERDINAFFKTLYKGSTDEQKRAMMKSFVESNGTALSTDWNEVKSRTVETKPPDGVEVKPWQK